MSKAIRSTLGSIQCSIKAPKGQRNTFGNYNYRSCEDILEAVKPLLDDRDATITLNDELVMIGDRYYVKATATITDIESGESIAVTSFAREEESKKGMDGSQVTGACSSYARKYALNALLLIDDNKDSDSTNTHGKDEIPGAQAPAKKAKAAPAEKPKPAPAPAPAPAPVPVKPAVKASSDNVVDPSKSDDVKLTEAQQNGIINAYENGLQIDVFDLVKLPWVGDTETWTMGTRRKLLKIYYKLIDKSISKESFLAGEEPVL